MSAADSIIFTRKGDRVLMTRDGAGETPVTLAWARPVSSIGREVAVLDEKGHELLMLDSLDELEPASRAVAAEELGRRYLVAVITRVVRTRSHYGERYWDVETDRGPRSFVIKSPAVHIHWISDDRLVIKDTFGNRFEIPSLRGLDPASRAEVERIL